MNTSTVSISSPAGVITGVRHNGINFFHSIPFAHFPSRFQEATAYPESEIDATTPDPSKIALSITAPHDAFDAPVLVYIHGGGFVSGTHANERTSGEHLAAHNIVTVNIGYRLGAAGMATFHDDEPAHFRAVNDCQLALEWVQRNIGAFGGDATRVTLMGHSAGGAIVTWLARRDHYRGAFRRAFASSPAFPRAGWEQRKGAFRTITGKPMLRESMEKISEKKLHRANTQFQFANPFDLAFGLHPLEVSEISDVPLLVTATREEFYNHPAARYLRGGLKEKISLASTRRIMGLRNPEGWEGDVGTLLGDSLIRRYVDQIAFRGGETWLAEFVGSQPVTHGGELEMLFAGDPTFVEFLTTGSLPWKPFHDDATAARWDIDDGTLHTVTDPLAVVRQSFSA